MSGARLIITYGIVAAALAPLWTAPANAVPGPVRYACPSTEDLTIQRDRSSAHVNFAGRTYDLQRKRSSIGDKYISSNAALIIDGDSAVFVAEDHLELGTCTKAVPVASER